MSDSLSKKQNADNCAIVIQARMSSRRFPNKMMSPLFGMPLIEYVYKRCRESFLPKVLIAISRDKSDDVLYRYCLEKKIPVIRGSLDNVLDRYIQAAQYLEVNCIVRVCGDTPFVDVFAMAGMLDELRNKKLDYISFDRKKCISGFFFEVVAVSALKKVSALTDAKEDLEHVTKYIIDHKERFSTVFMASDFKLCPARGLSLTIDYPEDIIIANSIVNQLPDKFSFSCADILNAVDKLKATHLIEGAS